jgi:two-component system, sensor histidine kinase and response regulator
MPASPIAFDRHEASALSTVGSRPALTGVECSVRQAGRRVLLVEDTPVNQQVARAILDGLGCEVVLAHDGLQGLSLACAQHFDAILMDCQMPVMDGFEASRCIRAAQVGGFRVPIIALTADALTGDRERCLQVGMDDYLAKPYTRAALVATLCRWLTLPQAAADPAGLASASASEGPV